MLNSADIKFFSAASLTIFLKKKSKMLTLKSFISMMVVEKGEIFSIFWEVRVD